MPAIALPIALALGVLLALLLLEVLIEREDVAAGLVLGLVVLGAAVPGELTSTSIGGIRVSVRDVGYSLVAAAALARHLRLRRIAPGQRALQVLAVVLVLSLLRGALDGIPSAFNDFRSYLGFVAAALYFATTGTGPDVRERIGRAWLWAGIGMGILVALRWGARFSGMSLGPLDATYDAAIRVLSGPETYMVATAALIVLLPGINGRGRGALERWSGTVLLLMAVVLNRRTVWLTLAVVLLVLVVRNPVVGRRVAALAVLGVVAFALLVPHLPGAAGEDRPAAQTASNTGTLLWRVEGWAALLTSGPEGPVETAIGQPFGRGYTREVSGRVLESTPHSYYLQTFLRTGAVGAAALIWAMSMGLSTTAGGGLREDGVLSRNTTFLLMLAQAVWFLTWAPGAEQGIVLGLAVAFARDSAWTRQRASGRYEVGVGA